MMPGDYSGRRCRSILTVGESKAVTSLSTSRIIHIQHRNGRRFGMHPSAELWPYGRNRAESRPALDKALHKLNLLHAAVSSQVVQIQKGSGSMIDRRPELTVLVIMTDASHMPRDLPGSAPCCNEYSVLVTVLGDVRADQPMRLTR